MLYQQHRDDVYTYFRRRVDLDAAQDCAAETFLVAWRRLADVPVGDRTRPWIFGVARHVLLKRYRVKRRDRRVATAAMTLSGPAHSVESIVEESLEDEAVHTALRTLTTSDRDLLLMVTWDELPYAEIASIIGCSPHAVDQRVHRALRRLRSALERSNHARMRQVARRDSPRGGTA